MNAIAHPLIRLLPSRDRRVKAGHPWAFSNEIAMTPAAMPSAPGKVAYTVNVANFRDEQAVAASLAMRLRGPNPLAVTAGIAYGGGANTAVRVGVAGEF